MFRVIIIEDDPNMRVNLSDIIRASERLDLVNVASSFESGQVVCLQPCDVILLDLKLGDGDGRDLIQAVRRNPDIPQPAILVLSIFGDEATVIRAIEAGADGYLLKDERPERLITAIADVCNGHAPVSPAIAIHLLKRIQNKQSAAVAAAEFSALTEREIDILRDLSKGLTYKQISESKNISYHTVNDHIKAIYRKLSVSSRNQAIYRAVRMGAISLND